MCCCCCCCWLRQHCGASCPQQCGCTGTHAGACCCCGKCDGKLQLVLLPGLVPAPADADAAAAAAAVAWQWLDTAACQSASAASTPPVEHGVYNTVRGGTQARRGGAVARGGGTQWVSSGGILLLSQRQLARTTLPFCCHSPHVGSQRGALREQKDDIRAGQGKA